jgi:uncharacterized protein YkwD
MCRTFALAVLLATVGSLLGGGAALAGAGAGASAESRAIASLNQIRTSQGLAALRTSRSLGDSANGYARTMLEGNFFGHQARIPVASRFRTAGETLAWHTGWRAAPRRTVRRWMASPSHRAILLSGAFRMIGMGMERGRLGGRPATMWVAHVGRR